VQQTEQVQVAVPAASTNFPGTKRKHAVAAANIRSYPGGPQSEERAKQANRDAKGPTLNHPKHWARSSWLSEVLGNGRRQK